MPERECRNWKGDLVIAFEMRERERVCVCGGGILFWKGDLVIAIEMRERESVCVCVWRNSILER